MCIVSFKIDVCFKSFPLPYSNIHLMFNILYIIIYSMGKEITSNPIVFKVATVTVLQLLVY